MMFQPGLCLVLLFACGYASKSNDYCRILVNYDTFKTSVDQFLASNDETCQNTGLDNESKASLTTIDKRINDLENKVENLKKDNVNKETRLSYMEAALTNLTWELSVHCGSPTPLEGSVVVHSSTLANYRCKKGFVNLHPGSPTTSLCQKNGNWTMVNMKCVNLSTCWTAPAGRVMYTGTRSRTITGKVCQRWDSQTPHDHTYTDDSKYWIPGIDTPQTVTGSANYCRDPSRAGFLWCYTTNRKSRWEKCDVPKCNIQDYSTLKHTFTEVQSTMKNNIVFRLCLCAMLYISCGYANTSGDYCQVLDNYDTFKTSMDNFLASRNETCRDTDIGSESKATMTTMEQRVNNLEKQIEKLLHDNENKEVRLRHMETALANVTSALNVDCGYPRPVEGSDVVYTSTGFHAIATYRCKKGFFDFIHPGQQMTSVCEKDGFWTMVSVKCVNISGCWTSHAERVLYAGTQSTTITGKVCQRWDSQAPHAHSVKKDVLFSIPGFDAPQTITGSANYCRDPDKSGFLWCYTTNRNSRWERCDVPKCNIQKTQGSVFSTMNSSVWNLTERVNKLEKDREDEKSKEKRVNDLEIKVEQLLNDNKNRDIRLKDIEAILAKLASECSVDCGAPTSLEGTDVLYSSTGLYTMANYRCKTGFLDIHPGQQMMSTCQKDGHWTMVNLQCVNISGCWTAPAGRVLYTGPRSKTITGKDCQRWDSQKPHGHGNVEDVKFFIPGFDTPQTVAGSANYCRDPDRTGYLWCYTTDPNSRWERCDVPECNSRADWVTSVKLGRLVFALTHYPSKQCCLYCSGIFLCCRFGGIHDFAT
ncbi:apolipoprotein(a)-like [Haliotis asinina]|uniref:apolipoprotein(a)-like n=1 Tax=Haliotis asinina TaxID=109174 RepID=UPI003531D80B